MALIATARCPCKYQRRPIYPPLEEVSGMHCPQKSIHGSFWVLGKELFFSIKILNLLTTFLIFMEMIKNLQNYATVRSSFPCSMMMTLFTYFKSVLFRSCIYYKAMSIMYSGKVWFHYLVRKRHWSGQRSLNLSPKTTMDRFSRAMHVGNFFKRRINWTTLIFTRTSGSCD